MSYISLVHRSCVTQLLSVLHSIRQKHDKNTQIDILYLDFAKAFDSVDHSILLQKLKCYGVTTKLLDWFSDHLNDRRQRVVVDGVVSPNGPPLHMEHLKALFVDHYTLLSLLMMFQKLLRRNLYHDCLHMRLRFTTTSINQPRFMESGQQHQI